MTRITINSSKKLGRIKPMHAVGQPPITGISTEMFHYLKEANIPYSRLHDVGGWFGGNLFVDIPNIFRDFEADENDPASYQFEFTDIIIKGLIENGCAPYFRLGVTIENFHKIRSFRIYPPADAEKWARICEHIIRHYNEGWADGFYYGIEYWEIWNEPDGHHIQSENEMWKGTREQYFDLYRTTSRHLRRCFGNSIKIGGYASCGFYAVLNEQHVTGEAFGTTKPVNNWEARINGFMEFFYEFVDLVTEEKLPFDFFSYHSYGTAEDNRKMQSFAESYLDSHGLGNVEIHLNEWNTTPQKENKGTSFACSSAVANMINMQNTKMQMMCYYDARVGISAYGGLFNPMTFEPLCAYYGFKAFGNLYAMGCQTEAVCDNDSVYVLSATNGRKNGVLVSNVGEDTAISVNLEGTAYLINEEHPMTEVVLNEDFVFEKNSVIYIEG